MFEGKYFYHGTTKKVITAFGSLFNSIQIVRDEDTTLNVPLSHAPTQHFIEVLNRKTRDDVERINQLLPRMSFYFSTPTYDPLRETDALEKLCKVDSNGVRWQYSPVPYNYTATLNIWTKYIDDQYHILEQILPYFRPDFNVTILDSDGNMDIKNDVSFILESVEDENTYESNLLEKNTFISTLTFTVKVLFYPPVEEGTLIKQAIINLIPTIDMDDSVTFERNTATVDPFTANPDDPFTILEVNEIINP